MPRTRRLSLLILILGLAAFVALLLLTSPRGGTWLRAGLDAAVDSMVAVAVAAPPDTLTTDGRSHVVRWRASFEAFAQQDRERPPVAGGVVFVGSSSIRLWEGLDRTFPGVVNRGFGGSDLWEVAQHLDRLVLPHRPRLVVVYAGENDLVGGRSPQDVLASYESVVRQIHAALPETRIVFVSIKPTRAREALMPQVRQCNALLADFTRRDRRLAYVDVHSRMLDADGRARADLLQPDGLHPSAAGYALWAAALAPYVNDVAPRMDVRPASATAHPRNGG